MGLIGPEQSYLINEEFWGANKDKVQELCLKVGIEKENVVLGFLLVLCSGLIQEPLFL